MKARTLTLNPAEFRLLLIALRCLKDDHSESLDPAEWEALDSLILKTVAL